MKVSEVSPADGRLCGQLLNLLKHGRWDLSGADITAHGETVRWVQYLAHQMAEQLKAASAPSATQGMKIKSAGPLPTKPSGSKKKK